MSETLHSVFSPATAHRLRTEADQGFAKTLLLHHKVARGIIEIWKQGIRSGNQVAMEMRIESIKNGEHAAVLGDKSQFPHLMRELGYRAPDSLLISQTISPQERINAAKEYYEPRNIDRVFIKPLNGTRQRDLRDFMLDEEGLPTYLASRTEDMLVQEFVPHEKVLRFVRYQNKKGEDYIAAFHYQDVPYIPPKGGFYTRKLISSGESYHEFYHGLKTTTASPLSNANSELANVSMFMSQALSALEQKLGGKVPFFSVDLAIVDMQALAGEYDEEKLRNTIVFIETQATPHPWQLRPHRIPIPEKSYRQIWNLFLIEHGKEMTERVKKLK